MITVATPPAPPCSQCQTTEGPIGKDGQHTRYRGYLWELPGVVCGDCRLKAMRQSRIPDAPPEKPPVPPCADCKTQEGSRNKYGACIRYRAEPFGFLGMLCATCYARAVRGRHAIAQGYEPGRVGRRPKVPPLGKPLPPAPKPMPAPQTAPTRREKRISQAVIARRARVIRDEHEARGDKPREGLTAAEKQQQKWAALAQTARAEVVASRHAVGAGQAAWPALDQTRSSLH